MDPPTYKAVNISFLLAHTNIPIPAIAKEWVDNNGRQFIMVDRVEGETLEAAWLMLPSDAKNRIAEQIANFVQQLRNVQSEKMAGIGDVQPYDGFLFLRDFKTLHMVLLHQMTSFGSVWYANWKKYRRKHEIRSANNYLHV